jgi:hypothetical protein
MLLIENNKAIENLKRGLEISERIQSKENIYLCNAYLGLVFYSNDDLYLSLHFFEKSISVREIISSTIVDNEYRIQYNGNNDNIYQLIVEICLRLDQIEKAYEYVNKSKSRAFIDFLTTSNIYPQVRGTLEEKKLVEQEERILKTIRAIQQRFADTKQNDLSNSMTFIGNESNDHYSRLDSIYTKLQKIDPEYVDIRRGKMISFNEIKNML